MVGPLTNKSFSCLPLRTDDHILKWWSALDTSVIDNWKINNPTFDVVKKKTIWIFFPVSNRRRHAVTVRVIEFSYHLSSVILNSFIITCVVRHFNFPESKIRGISFCPVRLSMSKIGTGASVFHKRILFGFEILLHPSFCLFVFFLLFEWEYVSFMMVSCIFWIGLRNGWVSYLNYAVHIYCKLTLYGYIFTNYFICTQVEQRCTLQRNWSMV